MTASASYDRGGDGRLWVTALMLSMVVNVIILGLVGQVYLKTQALRKLHPVTVSPPQLSSDTTVKILLEAASASPSAGELVPVKPNFARTSVDQTSAAPEKSPFIGERNTQATSDRSPDPTAPALPSQSGIDRDDLETTTSRYLDGRLGSDQPATPQAPAPAPISPAVSDPAMAANSPAGEKVDAQGKDDVQSNPPPGDALLEGASPVDVPVPRNPAENTAIKPTPPKRPREGTAGAKASDAPKSATEPGFQGYQRKSAIVGSISRTGRSALDVADSPLGRYQAAISRAVEREWQRNCVRHRDFITPGFLTVRFFVETSGKVRTVQFVGTMETGEVQKGFTLSAIRDADIPAMPATVKKDFDKEPLELIFNFYF